MKNKWMTDAKLKQQRMQLNSYCDLLVEDHEESIYAVLMRESDEPPDLKVLAPPKAHPHRSDLLLHRDITIAKYGAIPLRVFVLLL